MLSFAICDDNESIRTKFVSMLKEIFEKNDIDASVVLQTENPQEFYNYLNENHIDVALLDIDLRAALNGLDLAKKIRDINKSINIIFITAHIEYALLAFKVKTFDYLIKPVSFQKLEECILRLTQFTCSDTENFMKIKSGSSTYLIKKSDIIYIEKVSAKSYVYANNQIIETYYTLEEFEKILPNNFHRSHKSYVVNVNKISKIDFFKNEIIFNNSFKCYVGRKYKKSIMDSFEDRL